VGQRYRYAWFDGLNRYYVAEEHAELLQHFGVQPNVFDGFISHHLDKAWNANREAMRALGEAEQHAGAVSAELHKTEQHAAAVRAELHKTEQHAAAVSTELHKALQYTETVEHEKQQALDQVAQLQQELARLQQELAAAHASGHELTQWARDLEQRLTATLDSTSWKATRPLRMAGSLVIRLRRPGLVRRALLRATQIEPLRRLLIPILLRYPPLARRVSTTLQAARQATPLEIAPGIEVPPELRGLPASVRTVLDDLQRARELNK
jgi:hypothetical protein